MHMQSPGFIDMFSGAGLFSAGAAAVGLTPRLAVDVSKLAIASYNKNVAPVGIVGSVLDPRDLPAAEVLLAGPPCQGFSTLGRQDPLDVRNELALAVPVWADRCNADVVVIENVPPFLRSSHWRELARRLEMLGHAIQTWELDAVDFGTPQLRRRSFTIASRIGPLVEPAPSDRRMTIGDVLDMEIALGDPMHVWPEPRGIAAERIPLIPPKGDKRDLMRSAPHLCPASWEKVGCQATDVWGRVDPERPANTLRCAFQNPSKGRYLHPTENRTLSLREGARIQGIPDTWQFVGDRIPIARQIGNGVPIPLARAVAGSVMDALNAHRAKLPLAA